MSAYTGSKDWRVQRVIFALTYGTAICPSEFAAELEMQVDEVNDLIAETAESIGYRLVKCSMPVMH